MSPRTAFVHFKDAVTWGRIAAAAFAAGTIWAINMASVANKADKADVEMLRWESRAADSAAARERRDIRDKAERDRTELRALILRVDSTVQRTDDRVRELMCGRPARPGCR